MFVYNGCSFIIKFCQWPYLYQRRLRRLDELDVSLFYIKVLTDITKKCDEYRNEMNLQTHFAAKYCF